MHFFKNNCFNKTYEICKQMDFKIVKFITFNDIYRNVKIQIKIAKSTKNIPSYKLNEY